MNISDKKRFKSSIELLAHRLVNDLAANVSDQIEKTTDIDLVFVKNPSKKSTITASISFNGAVENRDKVKEDVDNMISGIKTVEDLKKYLGKK